MSYNSKYTGAEVEGLLDKVQAADGELATTAQLDGKVSKDGNKQLSTEDFTTALKNKLSGLENYDDTALNNALTQLRTEFDTLVGENASLAIDTFNEIIAFLDGISRADDLSSIIASIEQQIAGKQATISDLATIRSGAAAGATAVQPGSLSKVATSGSYNDLSNKPTIPDAQVNADWNATSGKAQILNKPTIPVAVTESTVSGWGFTKNTGTYSKPSTGIPASDLASAVQTSLGKADTALQSYTEKYTGTYSKPSTGIPKTDLASDVQTSLGKADTALQSHQDISGKQDQLISGSNIKTINNTSILGSGNISITGGSGTITEVKANGTSVATSGVANIPAASTSAYGVTKLSDATNSTSTVLAATANAVKKAYDLANSKTANTGTITEVKMNGASKGTSGSVDLGNVVTQVKFNGSTFNPTNGLVNLGTLPGGGGSSEKEIIQVPSSGQINLMQPGAIYIADLNDITLTINSFDESSELVDEYTLYIFAKGGVTGITIDINADGDLYWANESTPDLTILYCAELSIVRTVHSGNNFFKATLTHFG